MLRLLSRAPSLGPPEVFQYPLLRARDDLPLTTPSFAKVIRVRASVRFRRVPPQSELASNGLITCISDSAREA
jgi:hypothetical protein